jgi:hypothetical protein
MQNARILSELLEAEAMSFPKSANQGFQKVLSAISTGFYSHHTEVSLRCFKLV